MNDDQGVFGTVSDDTTEYLVDHHNFTGHPQVLAETTVDEQGTPQREVVYALGHDVIGQSKSIWIHAPR